MFLHLVLIQIAFSQTPENGFLVREQPGPKEQKIDESKLENGWHYLGNVALNLSLSSNTNVIGQVSGDTNTVGSSFFLNSTYLKDQHKWRNRVDFLSAFQRNPQIQSWIKTNDDLRWVSTYFYALESQPWLGPFAQVSAQTFAFAGREIREEPVNYVVEAKGSLPEQNLLNTRQVDLTDPFRPLRLRQSLGAFAKPYDSKGFKLEFRLGVGAQQVFARDQLTLLGERPDGFIRLGRLEDFSQSGFEGGVQVQTIFSKTSNLNVEFEFLSPVFSTQSSDETNWDLTLKYVNKMSGWLSFSYEIIARRQPALISDIQLQQLFVINLNYGFSNL